MIAPDGKFVAYKAALTNADTGVVLYRDLESGVTSLVATNSLLDSPPQISSDGHSIAYDSSDRIYLWDAIVGSHRLLSGEDRTAVNPKMTQEGGRVAYLVLTNSTFQIEVADVISSQTWLITQTILGTPSLQAHEFSSFFFHPSGNAVIFDSFDALLVTNDLNRAADIFVRWFESGETLLASAANQQRPASTGNARSDFGPYSLSEDGNFLVFASRASNLTSQDPLGPRNVFVKNLTSGALTALTPSDQFAWENSGTAYPVISGDGRYAVFVGRKSIVQGTSPLVLARADLQTGQLDQLADVNGFSQTSWGWTERVSFSMSRDGALVVYGQSGVFLADLVAGTTTQVASGYNSLLSPDATSMSCIDSGRVIIRELANGTNLVAGVNPQETASHTFFRRQSFSGNSRFLLYATADFRTVIYDRQNASNFVACANCDNPAISGDGRLLAYESLETGIRQIKVKDQSTGRINLITRDVSSDGGGNGNSTFPLFSSDGRFVVFKSKASNLVLNDANGWADLFVRDLLQGVTLRIAGPEPDTESGDGPIADFYMGPDGRTVIFSSFSSHLIPNDYNNTQDIFILKLGTGDTDNDGMPDDWEAAYFGNLDRDGTADFDHDGHTDLQEHVAGTDPTNENSILRVLTLTSTGTGQTQIFWSAVPGGVYRVEYKNDLNETAWSAFPTLVTASSSTATAADTTSAFGQSRFYRVVIVQ